ncbi:MAG: tRNA pseudouridine(38-40) synthase TruA [Bacteroidota bacterium]
MLGLEPLNKLGELQKVGGEAEIAYLYAMRYFAELSYRGTHYCGWQRQPNSPSVQEAIETQLSLILQQETSIVGCGRTDTGVHALHYFMHFDLPESTLPPNFLHRLNKMLPQDIVLHRLLPVADEAHARYDAFQRSYQYDLHFEKSPFLADRSFHYPYRQKPDPQKVQAAAQLLLNYRAFYPFCKSNSDVKTMNCELSQAKWSFDNKGGWSFNITANRFLRGMIRLIVGMCLNVGLDKVSLDDVRQALDRQERLQKNWSVPPEGLFLRDIRYPYISSEK